jgi:uncharacterized cupredoxin-like copper-binding protein
VLASLDATLIMGACAPKVIVASIAWTGAPPRGRCSVSTRFGLVAALGSALVIAACTSESASPGATTGVAATGAATTVDVTLQEWAVVAAQSSVGAGPVTFKVANSGPEDVHEFVILKSSLDPGALPVDETGAVTEDGEGIEVVDEIEDIPVGETMELTTTLAAGSYVLLCNIYSAEEQEAHYKMGMRTAFTVTE